MSDYEQTFRFVAPPQQVFTTLTNVTEFAAWWAPAEGSADDGELRVVPDGIPAMVFQVRASAPAAEVTWHVAASRLAEWIGTTVHITARPAADGGSDVTIRHEGLTPQLECYDFSRTSWETYLESLRDYIQTGTGRPYQAH